MLRIYNGSLNICALNQALRIVKRGHNVPYAQLVCTLTLDNVMINGLSVSLTGHSCLVDKDFVTIGDWLYRHFVSAQQRDPGLW